VLPGFGFGTSVLLNRTTAIIGQGYPSLLSYRDVTHHKNIGNLTGPPDFGFALCGRTPESTVIMINDGVKHEWATIQRLQDLKGGPALNLTFRTWTIYPGEFGSNNAGFSPDDKTLYILFQVDPHPRKLFVVDITTSPPRLLEKEDISFEYTHNVVVTEKWLYIDTDANVLSRRAR